MALVLALCFFLQRSPLRAQVQYEGTTVVGSEASALGLVTTAFGNFSFATGWATNAYGQGSIALGGATSASGMYSTSSGYGSTASGNYSSASGLYTNTSSYASFVIGQNNLGTGSDGSASSTTSWVATDPLFEIGNGTITGAYGWALGTPSDALVVYKNGNTTVGGTLSVSGTTASAFAGPVNVAPGGDIPMFTGD